MYSGLWMSPKPNKKWGKDKEILNMLDPAD